MTDEQQPPADRRVTEPPRAFDDEAAAEPLPAAQAPEEEEVAPEEVGASMPEAVDPGEPEEPAAFEDLSELPSLLEALLFVADHPVDSGYLARAVEVSVPRVEYALDALAESLREGRRGIRLQRGPAGAQLVSAPEGAAQVERFLGLEANRRLSQAALETLAIIAYRQPITRGQVDAVRGVSSDGAVATLRARDLIEAAGHAPGPGRPMLFRTTQRFLEHFGLERPGQLPPLPEDIELPPAEIQAQLGLDEATVLDALKPREEPALTAALDEPEDGHEDGDEGEDSADEPLAVSEDVIGTEASTDEVSQVIASLAAAAPDLDLPSDVQALTSAAEHAFEASRDRLTPPPDDA